MSTFTNWNGPECCGGVQPKTSDLLELITKYNDLLTKVNNHVDEKVSDSDNVHNVHDYIASELSAIETALAEKADATDLTGLAEKQYVDDELAKKANAATLSDYYKKVDTDAKLATKLDVDDYIIDETISGTSSNPVQNRAVKAALDTKVNVETLSDYATTDALETGLAAKVNKSDIESKLETAEVITDNVLDTDEDNILSVSHLDRDTKEINFGNENAKAVNTPNRIIYTGETTSAPYLTTADIQALDKVGIIALWPLYEEDSNGNMIAVNVPDGYLPCDGSEVPDTYTELKTLLGSNAIPLIDYGIIKAKRGININIVGGVAGGTLAEAVAMLHDSSLHSANTLPDVYYEIDKLPSSADTGTLALVYTNNKYYVFKKTAEGWSVQ